MVCPKCFPPGRFPTPNEEEKIMPTTYADYAVPPPEKPKRTTDPLLLMRRLKRDAATLSLPQLRLLLVELGEVEEQKRAENAATVVG
jgi:hypothetical protein